MRIRVATNAAFCSEVARRHETTFIARFRLPRLTPGLQTFCDFLMIEFVTRFEISYAGGGVHHAGTAAEAVESAHLRGEPPKSTNPRRILRKRIRCST